MLHGVEKPLRHAGLQYLAVDLWQAKEAGLSSMM